MSDTETIVVGIDGSDNSQHALLWAIDRAKRTGGRIRAVHSWHVPYAALGPGPLGAPSIPGDTLGEYADGLLSAALATVEDERGEVAIEQVVLEGPAARSLIQEGENADLLVVGSRGSGGFTGLLIGSATDQVVKHAPCPVVVVPAPDEG